MCAAPRFPAPWSRSLALASAAASLLCAGVPAGLATLAPGPAPAWLGVVLGVVLVGSAAFRVRGYSLEPGWLVVHRPFWDTRLALGPAATAGPDPEALRGAWRLCGNGGLFAISGWFWSRRLGNFRAWVNDPARSVVVRSAGRTLVVSPGDPAAFAAAFAAR